MGNNKQGVFSMIIKTIKERKKVLSASGLTGELLLTSDDLEFVRLTIEPGKEILPHKMHIKVIFYVISGTGLLQFDGKEQEVEKGSIVECEPDKERGWKNIGDDNLELFVIKRMV